MNVRTILHPTDFLEPSQAALDYAIDVARTFAARLIILHTVPTLGPEEATFGDVSRRREPEAHRQQLWENLHRRAGMTDSQVHVEYVLSEDEPAKAITDFAAQQNCDLIVLGTHGRHGLQRLLEGSVAERVIRTAPCPVLVVKVPAPLSARAHEAGPGTELHPHFLGENGKQDAGGSQQ